jgi:hypothetical protein
MGVHRTAVSLMHVRLIRNSDDRMRSEQLNRLESRSFEREKGNSLRAERAKIIRIAPVTLTFLHNSRDQCLTTKG